jgi:hypothetical protein
MKQFAFALLALSFSSAASAEDCRKYPKGPFRTQCVAANHPQVAAKRERCRQEAVNQGWHTGRGGGGAVQGSVQACMHRN